MHVTNPAEKEDLFDGVWCVVLDQALVCSFFPEKLEILHLTHVVHDLELMGQIRFHSFLYHISASHVPPNRTLKNKGILLDHQEDLAMPPHPQNSLNLRSRLVDDLDSPADEEPLETLLNLLS